MNSCELQSRLLKGGSIGDYRRDTISVIKGDTGSLDDGSCEYG